MSLIVEASKHLGVDTQMLGWEAAEAAARRTVQDSFEYWLDNKVVDRKGCIEEMRRLFEKDILPTLGDVPLTGTKFKDGVEVIEVDQAQLDLGWQTPLINRRFKEEFP